MAWLEVGYRLVEITSSGLSFNINQSGDIFGFGNKFIFTPTYNVRLIAMHNVFDIKIFSFVDCRGQICW